MVLGSRAEFDFPVNREIGKISLRHDLSVKIYFTEKFEFTHTTRHALS